LAGHKIIAPSGPSERRSTMKKTGTSDVPCWLAIAFAAMAFATFAGLHFLTSAAAEPIPAAPDRKQMLTRYCGGCHNDKSRTGNFSVASLDPANLAADDGAWEKILRRVSLGEMPPKGAPRPDKAQIAGFTGWLTASLDAVAAAHPDPGRSAVRRMNRAEYANAVRDLLGLDIDLAGDLPADDSGYGFDNIADVLTVSPTLMDRYMAVATKVSRLATGLAPKMVTTTEYKIPKDVFDYGFGVASYNERASDDLPLDSRGGGAFHFYAPYDATYSIQLFLNSGSLTEQEIDTNNSVTVRVKLKAGMHAIGAYWTRKMSLDADLVPKSTKGQRPLTVSQRDYLRRQNGVLPTSFPGLPTPRPMALFAAVDGAPVRQFTVSSVAEGKATEQAFYLRDVMQISVEGPFDVKGPGNTESRRRIFLCHPSAAPQEAACARRILASLAHRAYRRPVGEADIAPLMKVYRAGRQGADFAHGIEAALEAILVSPDFLFMVESDPPGAPAVHRLGDLQLATRLSFFLWSSIPDEQLLALAERGQLSRPAVLKAQVTRMLADPKAAALTENFAGQWLYLRKLDAQRPDHQSYPDFDIRLRAAMQTETEMFFTHVVKQNRPVLDFIDADYTFLNQRLAEHYGIPGIYGASFRKVQLDPASHRGGLLGQGAVLTVTSYNDRTSVVLRGKWILENILASPPPPPPPNVPPLDASGSSRAMTVRQQMEIHRSNPVCASCHAKIDPLGFALENYDAIGAWRRGYSGQLIDAKAQMPDGTVFEGPQGLQQVLLAHKDQFVEAFIERLMTYALGRGVEPRDMAAVRGVRAGAAPGGYRMQDIILGIVQSVPFSLKRSVQS
jgi:mono/diheme cytochrome c family protein